MKRNDQILLTALLSIGLMIAFWLLVVSPKRNEAADLKNDIAALHGQVEQAEQAAAAGQEARKTFDTSYRRLVVLGKAVPADSEQASLFVQLQRLSDRSGVSLQSIDLSSSGTAAPPPTVPTPPSEPSTGTADEATPVATPAPATEASAATLPIGASVGSAGLAVMPYDLTFSGGFFQIADFMQSLDAMVHMRHDLAGVNGRLLTVDSFTLEPDATLTTATAHPTTTPKLSASLSVTTYLTPADQGITAGATPSGPAPATPTTTSTTTTSSSTPTSSTSTSDATSVAP
jgi:Tfp pilus assembly protein PilO